MRNRDAGQRDVKVIKRGIVVYSNYSHAYDLLPRGIYFELVVVLDANLGVDVARKQLVHACQKRGHPCN